MGPFGDKRKKKSWQRLSFEKRSTRADILAREQALSHRVGRILFGLVFALATTGLIGFGRIAPQNFSGWAALFGLVLLIHFSMLLVVRAYHSQLLRTVKNYTRFFFLVVVVLVVGHLMMRPEFAGEERFIELQYLVPVPLIAITMALIYSSPLAISASAAMSAFLAVMFTYMKQNSGLLESGEAIQVYAGSLTLGVTLFLGCVVAVLGVSRIRNRTRLVVIGFASGAMQFCAVAFFEFWLLGTPTLDNVWQRLGNPVGGFLNGFGCGILVTSALPYIERVFDVTTDIRLIELADMNHPLLREFSLLAPGSWVHSQMVGQLAEEAAQSIGANDLLARVGAYYHDIGKMLKPGHFVENVRDGENRHDGLEPGMSRLIIIAHVKDGIRIAQEEGLPRPIVDMIPMHHGTSVVEYFYHKKRRQDEQAGLAETGEEAFQYPGPKPTFREAGILMLADSTEAISRVLSDPTPTRLRQVVRDVIHKKMVTGQLDECELTMRDLKGIEDAFVRVLAAIHHGRIKYPSDDPKSKNGRSGRRQPDTSAESKDAKGSDTRDSKKSDAKDPGSKSSSKESKAPVADKAPAPDKEPETNPAALP